MGWSAHNHGKPAEFWLVTKQQCWSALWLPRWQVQGKQCWRHQQAGSGGGNFLMAPVLMLQHRWRRQKR